MSSPEPVFSSLPWFCLCPGPLRATLTSVGEPGWGCRERGCGSARGCPGIGVPAQASPRGLRGSLPGPGMSSFTSCLAHCLRHSHVTAWGCQGDEHRGGHPLLRLGGHGRLLLGLGAQGFRLTGYLAGHRTFSELLSLKRNLTVLVGPAQHPTAPETGLRQENGELHSEKGSRRGRGQPSERPGGHQVARSQGPTHPAGPSQWPMDSPTATQRSPSLATSSRAQPRQLTDAG